jgi:hypothetical protein
MKKILDKYIKPIIIPIGMVVYICIGLGIRKMIVWLNSFHLLSPVFSEILGLAVLAAMLILGYRFLKYYYPKDRQ